MNLKAFLDERKKVIVRKWYEQILDSYPSDTSNFLRKQKDRFANPVGYTLFENIENLFNELIGDMDFDKCSEYLDGIIRVRAVQDFSPSQAIYFVFNLKEIIKDEIKDMDDDIFHEFRRIEKWIDKLALLAFDIYMKCKQQIFEIRVNEIKNTTCRLLKMANLIYDIDMEKVGSSIEPESILTLNIKG